MNNFLKFSFFILLASTELSAQISSEYVFGVNLSSMSVKEKGINYETNRPAGFHFGGCYEIPLSKHFIFQPSLLFSAKGADYTIDSTDYSITPAYFDVPVNMVFRFGSPKVKVTLFAGPYLAFGFGGYQIVSGGALQHIRFGSGEKHDLRSFDYGINVGAGIKLGGLHIAVRYESGLANISPVGTSDTGLINQVIGISFSGGSDVPNSR